VDEDGPYCGLRLDGIHPRAASTPLV
jgi:hypothetical protein